MGARATVIWRTRRWYALAIAAPLLFLPLSKQLPRETRTWVLRGLAVVVMGTVVLGERGLRRCVRRARGKPCLACGHCLDGLGESGVCPECGRPFQLAEDLAVWRRNVGRLRRI